MNAAEFKKILYHPKTTDKYQLMSALKSEGDIDSILKVLKFISSHPFVKSILNSNVTPKELKDLRRSKAVPFSGRFSGEVAFYLAAFEANKSVIDSFIALKENFDRQLLLENYESAQSTLTEIEKISGKSIWLIENQIILKEYKDGVQANWDQVSELTKNIKDPFLLFIIENLSKKAESKISYFRYQTVLNNQANVLISNLGFYEYVFFRLNYLAYTNYENLAYYLYVESVSSIIDRYLLLKEVLSEMFATKFKDQADLLFSITNKLFAIFPNDVQLCQILSLLSPKFVENLPKNIELNTLFKEYSQGNYTFCLEHGLDFIKSNPTIMEGYEIFVKSLIEEGKQLPSGNLSNNINNILVVLYNIYSNHDNIEQVMDLGFKICTTFSSTMWSKQLLSLMQAATSISNGNKLFTVQYLTHSKISNPRILFYVKRDNLEEYISVLKNDTVLNDVISTIGNIINGDDDKILSDTHLTLDKQYIFYGRSLISAKKIEEAKKHYEKCLIHKSSSPFFKEEILVNLFRCYIKLNQNKEACCLFVEHYLNHKEITKRFNKPRLLESLELGDMEQIKNLIELPIFFRIASFDSYQQYVAYDTYLESKGFNRPAELIKEIQAFDNKIIYFLREVCTIEIMHHSYHFNGTDDIESERLEILNKLIVNDKQNEDIYIKEITELNQNANIRKAIREVNKGRISVNVQQLRNNEAANIKEAFNRFKEIESYSKNKNIIGIDSSIDMLNVLTELNIDEYFNNKVVYTSDPAFISFKTIFIEIRDKFILSKEYGLDGYLSTRIRHGTLLNHIRSTFESENIISQRDKENNYLESSFWNENIPYYLDDKRNKIQETIKKYSRLLDEYTEYIIKELIQVKTEKYVKKSNALFDFSIANQVLAFLFTTVREGIKDHHVFLSFVFDYLQESTEKILSNIRHYINNEIKNNYNQILQDYNTEMKEILGTNNFPELINAINLCGTRIQDELKSISEWFYLSNSSKDLVLDVKVLIQTSVQITNTLYPNSRLNPKITEEHSIPMVGTIHLIYLCRILLDNIIIHSKLSPNELVVEISSEVTDEGYLEISFKNNFSVLISKEDLSKKLEEVKNKWAMLSSDYENIDVEGGSGFDKIRRIIAFDLECQRYKFDYKIEGNYLTIKLSIEVLNIPTYSEKE